MSATQSCRRPPNSRAGWLAMCVALPSSPSASASSAVAGVEPRLDVLPVHDQGIRLRHPLPAGQRVVVAGEDLIAGLAAVRLDLVRLGHEQHRAAGQRQVVEERRRTIDVVRIAGELGERHDRRLIDSSRGALRRGVVGPDRLDRVADELEPDRTLGAGRVEIDHAAAHAELARLVDRDPAACSRRRRAGRRDRWARCRSPARRPARRSPGAEAPPPGEAATRPRPR